MDTTEIIEYISKELKADVECIYESEYDEEIMLAISGSRELKGSILNEMKLCLEALQIHKNREYFLICKASRGDLVEAINNVIL